jgi:DNA-binding SARP family transcriptional activator
MTTLRLALLGTFEARLDTGPPISFARKKAEALLAYLALHPGQLQARDKLAALLWGDASDERARHSLRQALLTLRQALPRAVAASLVEEADAVGVNPAAVEVDVAVFERLTAAATPDALEQAAALYRGDLLEGITVEEAPFEEWLRTERERLRELAVDNVAKLLGHLIKVGAVDQAVQMAMKLLALDPAQEPVHRTLMRLYARQGRRGAALRQYQLCVGVLERELGVEPEADTKELYRELLQARPQPARTAEPLGRAAHLVTSDAPLVGRAVELAMLRERLTDAWQGRGAIGVIQGDAGIGKTRLVEALVTAAVDGGGQVVLGRAYESEQVLPLGPWVNGFRAGQVVPGLIAELDITWRAELARLFPELGPPEREATAGEDYVRLFEAMTRTVQHLASPRPLLIVLEDLHWSDEMTLRLLVFLGRRLPDWPVLVLGTVRMEELVDAPILRRTIAQLSHQPRFFSATLAPFSQAETVALVRTLMRARAEETAVQRVGEQAWRASEGNPFMAVETVRGLGGRDPGDTVGAPLTPPRVREVIAARLERLSDRGRRLAGVASVIGREFDFSLLERAAEASATETAEGVEELVAHRIFHVVGERLDFTHERIRDVAYDGLLPPYRRRLHEATARALEALHRADLVPHALALGRHSYASEAWDAASRYLAQAGASAAARSAHREAAACFEQAIDALRHLPASRETVAQTIDLRFEVRQSCVPLRDHARVLEHLRRAEAEAESMGDRERLGWAFAYLAHGLYISGDSGGAIEAGQRGLAIAEALADPALLESTNFYLAQVLHWVGDYRRGARLLRHNVTTLEAALRDRGVESRQSVNSRTFLGWCLAELGEFSEALAHTAHAIATAEAKDNAYWLVHACCGAGLVQLRRGAFDEAAAVAERAVELCRGRDFEALWAIPACILGLAYARTGRSGAGVPLIERAAEIASVLGAPVLAFLGEAYGLSGRADHAAAAAGRALELSLERRERGWQAWSLRLLGDIAASRDRPDAERAEDAYRRALALAAELGMRPLVAHCQLGLGTLYRRTDRRPQAVEHVSAATVMFGELGMAWWRGEADRERARLSPGA